MRFLAAYQIAGGIAGCYLMLYLTRYRPDALPWNSWLLALLPFVLLIGAGWQLWRGTQLGAALTVIGQLAQVPSVISAALVWKFGAGLAGIVGASVDGVRASGGVQVVLITGKAQQGDIPGIGINFIPLALLAMAAWSRWPGMGEHHGQPMPSAGSQRGLNDRR